MSVRHQLAAALAHRRRRPDFWLQLSVFLLLGLALWPVTRWLAENTFEESRLLHALVVLLFGGGLLVASRRRPVDAPLTLGTASISLLVAAYLLLLCGFFLPLAVPLLNPALVLAAYSAGLAAFFLFIYGEGVLRITLSLCGTLFAFLLLSLLMAPLDWPLRSLAGQWSGALLGWMGHGVELGLAAGPGAPPMLILMVDGHPFHVAAECNGFGVIFTSLLVALMLSIHKRASFLDLALNLASGLFLGFLFNILRIAAIVLLAPALMDHYHLMHEIVGALAYWGCLVLLWILLRGPTVLPSKSSRPETTGE